MIKGVNTPDNLITNNPNNKTIVIDARKISIFLKSSMFMPSQIDASMPLYGLVE